MGKVSRSVYHLPYTPIWYILFLHCEESVVGILAQDAVESIRKFIFARAWRLQTRFSRKAVLTAALTERHIAAIGFG